MIPDHPDRSALMDEVHARPIDLIEATCRVRRLVIIMPDRAGAMAEAFAQFARHCDHLDLPPPAPHARQHGFTRDGLAITWEFHTEFLTVTWRGPLAEPVKAPQALGIEGIAEGRLIGAMRIDVIADETVPDALLPGFSLPSLCLSRVEDGRAEVATDFVPDGDRFTRFEFAAGGLTPLRRSIIVRRLLEVETYRTMALLGLPLARAATPELREVELALSELVEGMTHGAEADTSQSTLEQLQLLSIRTSKLSERLHYRFAAGRAYGDILKVRLGGLREAPTTRGSTLGHYLGNRVDPGLATCAAVEKRLASVAAKIERAIGVLNVQIGVQMQHQNAQVLQRIAQTARSQFLLQRTVEGLSTIAISYYMLGILAYALAGPLERVHWDKPLVISIAAPFVIFAVWLTSRRIRSAHDH
ncbi:DUF3422 domain-containing protein [Devosia sp. FKR38]|uniref:DUF3422 domain-containing protein n=1 Tax=Devosia sp. FKR38 TaxID=2562312 RepID=UPI001484EC48|nr:DUF3422 domain-containing protein [Devosia sp. FKR38]